MDHMLIFQLSWGSLNNLLNGHFRFTCDGKGGMTHYRKFGVSRVATVGGRNVNGDAAVIAEAIEVAVLPFLLGKLAICPDAWVDMTGHGGIGCCSQVVAQL